jgi:hypothetical protein
MALKAHFHDDTKAQVEDIYSRIMEAFIRAGEEFVTNAREQMQDHAMGTYKDVTANLRNSVGYFIFQDGRNIFQNPATNEFTGPKSEGKLPESEIAAINLASIKDVIKPEGIQLIGVAGMEYASYVESKGYNVISYQADVCLVDLASYLERLDVIEKGTAAKFEESFIPE